MPQPQGKVVKMGEHEYVVFPQRIGYLMNRLGPRLQEAIEAEIDGVGGIKLVGVKAHDVLKVFIPDLMPAHEFLGYASEEALAADAYEEDADRSPDAPQIEAAFAAVKDVNGGAVLDHLKALVGALAPEMKERALAFIVAKMAEKKDSLSETLAPSPTSPPPSGGSDPTSSSMSPQTRTPSAD
jgi:hypothetical protein